jgi:hypothetical protein
MGLAIGWVFSREQMRAPAIAVQPAGTASSEVALFAKIYLFAGAALVVASFAPSQFRESHSARWDRAHEVHKAQIPSMDNLPEVQRVPPEQVLILNRLGDYLPGRASSAKTRVPKAPVTESYFVRYDRPGGPFVDVQVREYPHAAWAEYEILEQGTGIDLANPRRPVKFGSRIYGQEEKAADWGKNGSYLWASGNRLVTLHFFSAEPDEILKAYLDKFPTSASTSRPH